jgi:hypothetical protein
VHVSSTFFTCFSIASSEAATRSFAAAGTTASMLRTSFTPLTVRASSAALDFAAADSTWPCSVTTPSSVSTLIFSGSTPSAVSSSIFTFVVMKASSG